MKHVNSITLDHGAGGTTMRRLIQSVIAMRFGGVELARLNDGAEIAVNGERLVFTTDSYVIQPLEFPGGDIGKLAVCGTVNDLAVMGAVPRWLSVGFILEEGLGVDLLERICDSIARTALEAGVEIVTGDTKVVPRGACDQIFINTSGVGTLPHGIGRSGNQIADGDAVIVSGTLGEHALAVLSARADVSLQSNIVSDCAPLGGMIGAVLQASGGVKWMRDPTRGGLAASLDELAESGPYSIMIQEQALPVTAASRAFCDLLGYDPVHLANEGKVVIISAHDEAKQVLSVLRASEYGKNAAVIGNIQRSKEPAVLIQTTGGGVRRIHRPAGELLPRIC